MHHAPDVCLSVRTGSHDHKAGPVIRTHNVIGPRVLLLPEAPVPLQAGLDVQLEDLMQRGNHNHSQAALKWVERGVRDEGG